MEQPLNSEPKHVHVGRRKNYNKGRMFGYFFSSIVNNIRIVLRLQKYWIRLLAGLGIRIRIWVFGQTWIRIFKKAEIKTMF